MIFAREGVASEVRAGSAAGSGEEGDGGSGILETISFVCLATFPTSVSEGTAMFVLWFLLPEESSGEPSACHGAIGPLWAAAVGHQINPATVRIPASFNKNGFT